MECLNLVICAIFWCFISQAVSRRVTRCSLVYRNGGYCVPSGQPCPAGTEEHDLLSNFYGCFKSNHTCCAGKTQGVRKPDIVSPTPARNCGIGSLDPSSRILNGVVTAPCDWPFVVSIRGLLAPVGDLTFENTSHVCSGVLIDKQWVLTSPVCVFSAGETVQDAQSRILVVAGDYNVSDVAFDPTTGTQQEELLKVSSVHIHPNHTVTSLDQVYPFSDIYSINSNAVALIKLAEPIKGRCSGIVCLPTQEDMANGCASYDNCVITGWGFSTETFDGGRKGELLLGRVRLFSVAACDFLTEKLGLTSNRPKGTTCQSPLDWNADSCSGDEGGAVMCSNGNSWVVRGILPFNTCRNKRYNFYTTRVAEFLDWILATMNI